MLLKKRVKTVLNVCIYLALMHVYATQNSEIKERNPEMNKKVEQAPTPQPHRPQTPQPPFPYTREEVSYENKDRGITLSGTLSLPNSREPFPVVILIAGMGSNDRDYSMLGHKLFLVMADYLVCHGIAVLCFDKRGVGKSTGTYSMNLTSKDFADDVLASIEYLKTRKDINIKHIGLLGHSEGAIIASMVGSQSKDVSFLILLAGNVLTNIMEIVDQIALQLRADGASQEMITSDNRIRKELLEIVKQEPNFERASKYMHQAVSNYWITLAKEKQEALEKIPFAITNTKADSYIAMFNSPWYRYFLNYNPVTTLEKITIPVLALNGDTDFITSSEKNLPIIARALQEADNQDYTIIALRKMNHWFQECQTGALAEYSTIEETISPKVLKLIAEWIVEQANK